MVCRRWEGTMRIGKVSLALAVLITVLAFGFNCYAQPNIPKENIPSDLAAALKAEGEGLYAPEVGKRAQAAINLGTMGEKAVPAIPFLIGILGDTAGVELKTGPEAQIANLTSPAIEAAVALGKIGTPALEPLIGALKDKDPNVRVLHAGEMEELEDLKAVKPLIAALKDENFNVQATAARALGEINDPTAVEPLIAALKDKKAEVRGSAAAALGEMGDKKATLPLIAALKDPTEKVRRLAAVSLGEISDTRADQALITALKDKDAGVRAAAAGALGEIHDVKPSLEPLIAASKDKDPQVRAAVMEALGGMNAPKVEGVLISALQDSDANIRMHAAAARDGI